MGRFSISNEQRTLQRLTQMVDRMVAGNDGALGIGVSVMRPEPDAARRLATPDRWAERPLGYLQLDHVVATRSLFGRTKLSVEEGTRLPVLATSFTPIEGTLDHARQAVSLAAASNRVKLDDGEYGSRVAAILEDGDGALHQTWPTVVTPHGEVALTVEQPAGVYNALFHSLNDSIRYLTNGTSATSGPFDAGSGIVALGTHGETPDGARLALKRVLKAGDR